MSDINDQITKAIQAYADTLPNADFKLNLLAAAEDMAPKIVESMALQQEWAVMRMETYTRTAADGTELPLMEDIGWVGNPTDDYQVAHQELEWENKARDEGDTSRRLCIGGRIFTDWVEDVQPQIDPELEAALNLPGT
jgi:hypothetical protein